MHRWILPTSLTANRGMGIGWENHQRIRMGRRTSGIIVFLAIQGGCVG